MTAARFAMYVWFDPKAAAVAWAQSPFTLEQVLSSPFRTSWWPPLRTAARGMGVQCKGVRNVWVADGPVSITARQITHYRCGRLTAIASLRLTRCQNGGLCAGHQLNEAQSANPPSSTKRSSNRFCLGRRYEGKMRARPLGRWDAEEDCNIQISPDSKWALWSAKKKLSQRG
jgi:hypothetical protein